MKTLFKNINILAIELPSFRISPLIRIAAIVSLYAVAVLFIVIYIQLIGSGIGIFSGLFHVIFISQSIEIFFKIVGALILMPWLLSNMPQIKLWHLIVLLHVTLISQIIIMFPGVLEALAINTFLPFDASILSVENLLLFSLLPVKPRLNKVEKEAFLLSQELKDITIGLLLGDLYARKQKLGINACLVFKQGIVHEDYLNHLYKKFQDFCPQGPKIIIPKPNIRTGKVHRSIYFSTYSLPCFNDLYNLFYPPNKKAIPLNIAELLTPSSLAYWICDDGCFCKRDRAIILCTDGFTLEEVKLLIGVLTNKFGLNCTINASGKGFRIKILAKSLPVLQSLLSLHMPSMMLYKIGL
jgi:hypothetical protein